MSNRRLTIAVDFGTTYSGVAYSNPTDETREPQSITDWGSGPTSVKVPTVLRYNASDRIGGLLGAKWGFEVKHHERRQEWFKLALDPMVYMASDCVDMSRTLANELAEPPDYSRTPVKLCTDYLAALKKQAWSALQERYAMRTMQIDWVITVPAVWSTKAKSDTLKCAHDAGIGGASKVKIVSEPEAAAAFALQAIEPLNLKEGQNFVVCDAGGGTVDLITYRLLDLEPMEVEESAIPCGGKCGGSFVNRIFEKMIMERIGRNSGLTELGKHKLLNEFEQYAKRDFKDASEPDEEWQLPVPGARNDRAANIENGLITITVQDMQKVFDPVVEEVIKLVQSQIRGIQGDQKCVKAVLLVGGFGESRYLKKRLGEAIAPIDLLCPGNGWGAVALGAVIRGIAMRQDSAEESPWDVRTRKATAHHGITIWKPFIEGTHIEANKVWDSCDGIWRCDGIMRWFTNRGDNLSTSEPQVYRFHRNIRANSKLKVTEDMLFSLEETAPKYYDHGKCHDHAELKVDLSRIKNELNAIVGKDGKDYYSVNYQILATWHSAHVEYQWRYNGEIFDKVKCNYA